MINLLSLFSGIGAFETALTNLNIDYTLIGFSEIDRCASEAYALMHGVSVTKNLGDITKINEMELAECDLDLLSYGFPCQDISIAGNQRGFIDEVGNKTRSGLFFDALRIIKATKPKIAIAENVKNLASKNMESIFELVLSSLDEAGYNNYWKVVDAFDYGIPQHRERVLIVSIRKDIDNGKFAFPVETISPSCFQNYLDKVVPENYYLPEWKTENAVIDNGSVIRSNTIVQIGDLHHYGNDQMNRIYSPCGICPTLKTVSGGGREIKILDQKGIRALTPSEYLRLMGYSDAVIELLQSRFKKTALYRMAGNSIVVDVLMHLFKSIFATGMIGGYNSGVQNQGSNLFRTTS